MVIKLYIDYVSQPSRAVLAFCLFNKIPIEIIEVSIFTGAQRKLPFVKINPMKKVPAIEDTQNNLCLAESHTILRYLSSKFNVPEHWYPRKDFAAQAKINQFLDFHHMNTRRCSYLVFHTLFAPLLKSGDPTFSSDWTYKVVKAALRNFQTIYLQQKRYVGGEEPCIADLIAFYDITMVELLDYDFTPFPKIVRWVAEMRKIKEISQADEKFMANREALKALRPKPEAKL